MLDEYIFTIKFSQLLLLKKKKNLNYSEFVEGIYNKLNPKLIINLPRVTIFAL